MHGQETTDTTVYLDGANNKITKEEFIKIAESKKEQLADHTMLLVHNDTLDILKIVENRCVSGKVANSKYIYESIRNRYADLDIQMDKPLIVFYNPGKDGGSTTSTYLRRWYKDLEKKINKLVHVKPVYIYRRKEGTARYGHRFFNWKKDPDNIIEYTFFEFHYACGSFVILMPDGKFMAYYAEYGKEDVLNCLSTLLQNK